MYPLKASSSHSRPELTMAVTDTNVVGVPAEEKERKKSVETRLLSSRNPSEVEEMRQLEIM